MCADSSFKDSDIGPLRALLAHMLGQGIQIQHAARYIDALREDAAVVAATQMALQSHAVVLRHLELPAVKA